jgi:hypothetical protein
MRLNISKSEFFAEQIEYLTHGYWITRRTQSIRNKAEVNTMLNIKAPNTGKEAPATPFIGMVNYYRNM